MGLGVGRDLLIDRLVCNGAKVLFRACFFEVGTLQRVSFFHRKISNSGIISIKYN